MEPTNDLPLEPLSPTVPNTHPGRGHKLSPKTIAIRQRDAQAAQLRLAGWTWQAISDRLGYSGKAKAYEAVDRLMLRTIREPADALRDLTVARLDRMLVALWPFALGLDKSQEPGRVPSLDAVDRVLNIERTRAKLLGLNVSEKVPLREVMDRIAEVRGYDADEKKAATEFVENYLKNSGVRS